MAKGNLTSKATRMTGNEARFADDETELRVFKIFRVVLFGSVNSENEDFLLGFEACCVIEVRVGLSTAS